MPPFLSSSHSSWTSGSSGGTYGSSSLSRSYGTRYHGGGHYYMGVYHTGSHYHPYYSGTRSSMAGWKIALLIVGIFIG